MKKLASYLAVFAMAIMSVLMLNTTEIQATTFEDIKVYTVDDMTNFDQTIGLSWQKQWSLNSDAGVTKQVYYGKFTLAQDSIVRIKLYTMDEEAFAADDFFRLYGTSAMVAPLVENNIQYGEGDDWVILKAGTYYAECGTEKYMKSTSDHVTKVLIGAVPLSKAVKVEQIASADRTKMTVKLTPYYANEFSVKRWKEGKLESVSTYGSTDIDASNAFTVTKNGWYSVTMKARSTVAWNQEVEYTIHVKVSGIGAGAKKGVTYKVNNLKYKVVKAGFDGKGTVAVTGIVKQKASVTIPKTVKIKGHDYKIVKIASKAFYKKSKIKKITIKATTITSIGKNAIKGINKNAKIYVPKSRYAKYKKMLTAKTGFAKKSMKIKKK